MLINSKMIRFVYLSLGIMLLYGCGSKPENTGGQVASADTAAKTPDQLFVTCTACHGQNGGGNETMFAPGIVNQDPDYLVRQLKNLKGGVRGGHEKDTYGKQMVGIAANLKDSEIEPIVKYIKTLPPTTVQKTVKGNVEAGKAKYTAICAACHGPDAAGNKALFAPRLTGVGDWYLKRQVHNFIEGIRGAHPQDVQGAQMAAMAKTIGDDQAITDVVAYIQTLEKSK